MADKTEMVYIKINKELLTQIEEYRKNFNPLPNRSEAIRQLIKLGLESRQ